MESHKKRLKSWYGVLITLSLNCTSTPLDPAFNTWENLAYIPEDFTQPLALVEEGRTFGGGERSEIWFVARHVGEKAMVGVCRAGKCESVFVSDYESVFEDIAGYYFGKIVAGGNKAVPGGSVPYAVTVDVKTGEVTELDVTHLPGRTISAVLTFEPGEMWFTVSDHSEEFWGTHAGIPVFYKDGVTRTFENIGPVTPALGYTAQGRQRFFGVEYPGDNLFPKIDPLGPGYIKQGKLFITDDGGATWKTELLPRYINSREVHAAFALAVRRPNCELYLKVKFKDGAVGIVRRSGSPGAGTYSLEFLSYPAPWFLDIRAAAFNTAGPSSGAAALGLALGKMTTVYRNARSWAPELITYPRDFLAVTPLADGGYAALSSAPNFGRYEILYHP